MEDARVTQAGKLEKTEVFLRVSMDCIDRRLQSPQAE